MRARSRATCRWSWTAASGSVALSAPAAKVICTGLPSAHGTDGAATIGSQLLGNGNASAVKARTVATVTHSPCSAFRFGLVWQFRALWLRTPLEHRVRYRTVPSEVPREYPRGTIP